MFTIHPWNCDLDIYLIYNLLDSLSHIFEQEVYQIIFHQIQRLDCSLYVQTIHQRVLLTYPFGGVSLDTAHATQGVAECDTVHWVGTGLLLGEGRNHWFYAPLDDSTSGTSRLIDFGGWNTSASVRVSTPLGLDSPLKSEARTKKHILSQS